jgi:transcriptional regulator with XRE-family HTH domain
MDIKIILGENIRNYRKKRNLTQDELAEKLDISQKHLSNIEVGRKFVTAPLLERISDILKVSPSLLFYSGSIDELDNNILKQIDNIINEELKNSQEKISGKLSDSIKSIKERIRGKIF